MRGYDALAPAGWLRRREAMGRFTALPMVTDVLEPWDLEPGGEALDFWNVEYLLAHPQLGLTPEGWGRSLGLDLEVVYDGPDGRVFQNRRVLPRVRCEGGGEVRLLERTPLRWLVATDAPAGDRLVVADPWFPGWRVLVDAVEVPLDLEPGAPIEVPLAPGRHRVEVVYQPRSFRLGLWLAAASLALLLAWMVLFPATPRRRSS